MKVERQGIPDSFKRANQEIDGLQVRVGFFPEAHYPDGTSVAYVATIQEFGYPQGNIPARPFMRPTAQDKRDEWSRQVAGAIVAAHKGDVQYSDALDQIGGSAAGDVALTIKSISTPPLDESTLRSRRSRGNQSAHPLIDTSLMFKSVTHKVESDVGS